MARKRLDPPAAALIQSLRGVGYDTRTAIADLIDNSITAESTQVHLQFVWRGTQSYVSLLDNGYGMDAPTLDRAMLLGSWSPLAERRSSDLGRFGLGLKTASFSQCSRLIVASKRLEEPLAVRVWDLGVVRETNDWLVEDGVHPEEEPLLAPLASIESGTLVIWTNLDLLVGRSAPDDERARLAFQRASQQVESHLSMVFHRYLEGPRPKLRMYVNGDGDEFRVRPWDPFCTAHGSTQQMPEVRRGTRDGVVVMQGFILPHKDRLSTEEHDQAAGPGGWVSQQGFYVYRNNRLLVSGSWLGLGTPSRWTKGEQHKLARIRLDVPTTGDASWAIDIKKSRATPPLDLRDWLERNGAAIRSEAREVFVHRGARRPAAAAAAFSPAWLSDSAGDFRYRVNRDHPAIAALLAAQQPSRASIEGVFRLLESTLPLHRIWLDVADRPETPAATHVQLPPEDALRIARDLVGRLMSGQRLTLQAAVERLRHTEPFDQYPSILAALLA